MPETPDTVLHHQVQEAVTGLTQIAERLAGYVERLVLLEERNNSAAIRLDEHKLQVAREVADLKILIAATTIEMKAAVERERQDNDKEREKDRLLIDTLRTSNIRFQTIYGLVSAAAVIIVPIIVMKWIGT